MIIMGYFFSYFSIKTCRGYSLEAEYPTELKYSITTKNTFKVPGNHNYILEQLL